MQSQDGLHRLAIQGRVQGRLESSFDVADSGAYFLVPRARLALKGHSYTPDLGYKFQADFGKGGAALKDFYIDYRFASALRLRAGQYTRPFSRQQLTSSGKQQFVDRSIVNAPFMANFMLPVPEASIPAVEICSERSAAGMMVSA